MPRLSNLNPAYRKHRASGQGVVTIEGRDFYLGPWGSKASKTEYDRIIGEWLANGRRLAQTVGDISVAELVLQFWTYAKEYYREPAGKPTIQHLHFKAALDPLVRLYRDNAATSFGPLALDALRNVFIGKGWSRTYVNSQIGKIRLVFKWAVSRELVPPSVHQALCAVGGLKAGKSAAKESAAVEPVADAVVDATLPHLSTVVRSMVQMQRFTGARPGEICSMKIGELDKTGEIWTYKPATHKNHYRGHRRIIHLGPKAQDALKPFLLKIDPTAHVFSPAEAMAEMHQNRTRKTPINEGNRTGHNRKAMPRKKPGEFYDVHAYRRAIASGCDTAFPPPKELSEDRRAALVSRVKSNDNPLTPAETGQLAGWRSEIAKWKSAHRWHPHQLRHLSATAIRRQFGLEAAQATLGHASMKAAEIYAERSDETARNVAAKIG